MYQYPNYSMNNAPQFQQQYQPQQMPIQYMDRLSQLQAAQQPMMHQQMQRAPGLNGGVVEDFNVITANDVPMDGNGAVFIKRDGSEIQVRNWTAQGTISTSRFKPVLDEQTTNPSLDSGNAVIGLSGEVAEAFMRRFDEMDKRFDRLEKSMTKQPASRSKKEEVAEYE